MKIEGGTGTGYSAKVNRRNQLVVESVAHSEESQYSVVDGQSFFANTADTAETITVGNSEVHEMLYLKNLSATRDLVIEKILSSASVAGGVWKWTRNPTLGTIGAHNVHVPKNLNFGSGVLADVLAYNTDETTGGMTGFSGGDTVKTFITGVGFTVHPIDAAIVIPQNQSILLTLTTGASGAGEYEAGIRFYMREIEA